MTARLLVVCLGNHCRSPLAAAALARHGGAAADVRSAGLSARHTGQPAHPFMIAAAGNLGYDLSGHRGAQITPGMLAWAGFVLAMDRAVLDALRQLAQPWPGGALLRLYLAGRDVPDPWGNDEVAFAACAALIETGAAAAVQSLNPAAASTTPASSPAAPD